MCKSIKVSDLGTRTMFDCPLECEVLTILANQSIGSAFLIKKKKINW